MEMERVRRSVSAVPHVCLMVDRSLHRFLCVRPRLYYMRTRQRARTQLSIADIVRSAYRLPMGPVGTDAQARCSDWLRLAQTQCH